MGPRTFSDMVRISDKLAYEVDWIGVNRCAQRVRLWPARVSRQIASTRRTGSIGGLVTMKVTSINTD